MKLERGDCFTRGRVICPSVMPRNKPKCKTNTKDCLAQKNRYKRQLAKDRADYKPIPKSKWKPIGRPPLVDKKEKEKVKKEYEQVEEKAEKEALRRFGEANTKDVIRERKKYVAKEKRKFRNQNKKIFPKQKSQPKKPEKPKTVTKTTTKSFNPFANDPTSGKKTKTSYNPLFNRK